ncbi:MAG TPA: Fe2+-dependent dioxygenase [Steroidobacteraceae bacterium]|jgi:PKHD-type hydroxylase|nr:Fe2+-dependent dioxygenase [Steroidobacteraceae bacterium]
MFLQIPNLLTPAEVQSIAQSALQAKFIDGRRSNPHNVVKQNVIADQSDTLAQNASQIALLALQRSEEARNFVFPRRIPAPTLSRYAVGMKYGPHTDAAFLPVGAEPLRSDVSCTIFISQPNEYQGGELVIHLGTEAVSIKGPAGSAIFYPSTTIHQVVPVTAGERLVMITFIESQIPDQLQREMLYSLGEVRALEGLKMEWQNRTQIEFVIANLHRMWAR